MQASKGYISSESGGAIAVSEFDPRSAVRPNNVLHPARAHLLNTTYSIVLKRSKLFRSNRISLFLDSPKPRETNTVSLNPSPLSLYPSPQLLWLPDATCWR